MAWLKHSTKPREKQIINKTDEMCRDQTTPNSAVVQLPGVFCNGVTFSQQIQFRQKPQSERKGVTVKQHHIFIIVTEVVVILEFKWRGLCQFESCIMTSERITIKNVIWDHTTWLRNAGRVKRLGFFVSSCYIQMLFPSLFPLPQSGTCSSFPQPCVSGR